MRENISALEAAKKWNLTSRRVTVLCSEGRIPGAQFIGKTWVIPADAEKPTDARVKNGKYKKVDNKPKNADNSDYDLSELSASFQALINNPGFVFQVFDFFPMPIEIFDATGLAVYVNRALMEFLHQSNPNATVGKLSILNDPASDAIFGHDTLVRMMSGEPVTVRSFPVPVQDQIEKGVSDEKPFEAATMDVHSIPVWNGTNLAYVICIFQTRQIYTGRADVAKAQEYIRQNWMDAFDMEKAARAANLSLHHFQRTFKEIIGMTPLDFYRQIKIEKIKEKLLDPDLSVEQAFENCGVDSRGSYLKLFKKEVGKSPVEYRKEKL